MNRLQEINERLEEIRGMLDDAEKRGNASFEDLEQEVRDLKEEKKELETRERLRQETEDLNNGEGETRHIETFNAGQGEKREEQEDFDWEERGEDLYEKRAVTVSSGDLVTPDHDKASIKGTFNQVSTLVDRVNVVPLNGGESYEAPYEVSHGEGNYTAEGDPYFDVTQEFGYATINKTKVTAYNEITEEVLKLPRANYAQRTIQGVRKALRKKITKEILVGTGNAGEFTGIFSSNATAINPATDIEISAIDEDTLDTIIYSYGGDEDVEDEAVLILSKADLRAFAQVRLSDGKKAYEVVNNGNTGTINGVQYIINSSAGTLSTAADGDYLMAYGPLSNYEMAVFSKTDVKRSDDVKFKEGMIAHRGSVFAGGNVVAQNGFLRVKKAPAV